MVRDWMKGRDPEAADPSEDASACEADCGARTLKIDPETGLYLCSSECKAHVLAAGAAVAS